MMTYHLIIGLSPWDNLINELGFKNQQTRKLSLIVSFEFALQRRCKDNSLIKIQDIRIFFLLKNCAF